MIIRGLVHIDASVLVRDEAMIGLFADGEVEEDGARVARITHPISRR
jgi:hypothetical protein